MIQRIQTIFLILAFIAAILLIIVPLVSYKEVLTEDNIQVYVTITKINNAQIVYSPINIILFTLMVISPFIIIFLYKNRLLQVKLCYISLVITLILVMVLAYKFHSLDNNSYSSWQVKAGVFLFSINIIFILLAKHFILKDQELIESSNRLR